MIADIEAGADSITFDLTGTMEQLLLNTENREPLKFKTVQLVGKEKILTKQFDGIEYGPYLLPGDQTVEVEEFKGQGVLWSWISIYLK